MNDYDICVYLSVSNIALVRVALQHYGYALPARADDTTHLSARLAEAQAEHLAFESLTTTENRVSDIQNPSALTDFDWLEFVSFVWKTENEGFDYAYENYSPRFEMSDLRKLAADMGKFSAFYDTCEPLVEPWAEAVGWERAGDLVNAHVDETRKRELNTDAQATQ